MENIIFQLVSGAFHLVETVLIDIQWRIEALILLFIIYKPFSKFWQIKQKGF